MENALAYGEIRDLTDKRSGSSGPSCERKRRLDAGGEDVVVKHSRSPVASALCPSRMEVLLPASLCTRALEKILADTADGAFVVDPGGLIVFRNRAAERLLGHSAQEVVGLTCWNFF